MHHPTRATQECVRGRIDWDYQTGNIQSPKWGIACQERAINTKKTSCWRFSSPLRRFSGAEKDKDNTCLVVPNTVLLVRSAQGDGGDDCTSVRIWVRADVDGSSAKAVNDALIELFELGMSIDR